MSGEEVGYPGLHAGRRVHDCVGEVMREEVGILRVRVPRGGNREIARLDGGRSDRWLVLHRHGRWNSSNNCQ